MLPVPLRTASLNVNFIDLVVKSTSITYKKVEAESPEQAEEFALCEDVNELEEYVEVEEDEEDEE